MRAFLHYRLYVSYTDRMHEIPRHLQAVNDNRSFSEFWNPEDRKLMETVFADALLCLDMTGVDEDTIIEGLFECLFARLLPREDEREWSDTLALKRYCQIRRFSGELTTFGNLLTGKPSDYEPVIP